jgi:dienelactone hydrolase
MYPVFRGTYERRVIGETNEPASPIAQRDETIDWCKEVRRSIDYLETRDDIDTQRIGYYGVSWGASYGPIHVAVEERIKLAVLSLGGFHWRDHPPATDPLNFVSRVRVPVLMISGEHDILKPVEEATILRTRRALSSTPSRQRSKSARSSFCRLRLSDRRQ